jgi:hypothetical protein
MPTMLRRAAAGTTAPVRADNAAPLTVTPWRAVRRAGAALFAVMALVLAVQPAVLASSAPAPTWTKQAPATHPPAQSAAAMAYDAATGTTVLFGEDNGAAATWTWDGSTWTKQAPATSPSNRDGAAMAYDAATATIVVFGGRNGRRGELGDTWTWDGSTWTKQHPATRPSARSFASMAYDAATGTTVLFGGGFDGTWTWG